MGGCVSFDGVSGVKYFLVIILSGPAGPPAITTAGPFSDLLACEKAAAMTKVVVPPRSKASTICLGSHTYALNIPKDKP